MASDAGFIQFVVDQLAHAGEVERVRMFGEAAIYFDGKVVGLVVDNRFFLKPTEAGRALIGTPDEAKPFPGAKDWFDLGDRLDDAHGLGRLVKATANELPLPKPKPARKSARKPRSSA